MLCNEVSKYANFKMKAQLFLKVWLTQEHQKQLENILDCMPDSVLVYEQRESPQPKTHFCNANMNTLFNCNIQNFSERTEAASLSSEFEMLERKKLKISALSLRQKHPLNRRIFTPLNQVEI